MKPQTQIIVKLSSMTTILRSAFNNLFISLALLRLCSVLSYATIALIAFAEPTNVFAGNGNDSNEQTDERWAFWNDSDEENARSIDHSQWQTILDRYLDAKHPSGINRFAYKSVIADDQALLANYIEGLEAIDPLEFNRQVQKAYWINLYNALTVKVIIDKKPIYSILTTGKSWLPKGPWDDKIAVVNDESLTLNNIEHNILRPLWQDPRIHFAVNCASLGCPNLQEKAFTQDNIENLMTIAAQEFMSHPRGLKLDRERLTLSSIFEWYQEDFGNNELEMLVNLTAFVSPDIANKIRQYEGKVRYQYDWKLNKL